MTAHKVWKAKREAEELIRRIKLLPEKKVANEYEPEFYWPSKVTGSIRRQSMELTRSLAELRKP